ncbi:MAG: SMI1/KNR4 family protein [Trebonia sp.]
MGEELEQAWARVTRWLREHAPASYETLRPPAEQSEIEACENALGLALPEEYKRLLLLNNGAAAWDAPETAFRPGAAFLAGGYRPLSAEEAGEHAIMLCEVMASIDEENMIGSWWHPQWVMFGLHNAGDGLAIDQRPGPGQGAVGEFENEGDTAFDMAPSLSTFLATMADCLETGSDFRHFRPIVKDGYLDWGVVLPDRVVLTPGFRLEIARQVPREDEDSQRLRPAPRPEGVKATTARAPR